MLNKPLAVLFIDSSIESVSFHFIETAYDIKRDFLLTVTYFTRSKVPLLCLTQIHLVGSTFECVSPRTLSIVYLVYYYYIIHKLSLLNNISLKRTFKMVIEKQAAHVIK